MPQVPYRLEDSEIYRQLEAVANPPDQKSRDVVPPRRPWTEDELNARFNHFGEEQLAKAKALRGLSASLLGDDLSNIQYDPRFAGAGGILGMYNHLPKEARRLTMVTPEGRAEEVAVDPDQIAMFTDDPTTLGHELMHRNVGDPADDEFLYEVDAYTQPDKESWDKFIDRYVSSSQPREVVEARTLNNMEYHGDKVPDQEMMMGAEYKHLGFPDYSMVPDEYAREQYRKKRAQQSYWARELRNR